MDDTIKAILQIIWKAYDEGRVSSTTHTHPTAISVLNRRYYGQVQQILLEGEQRQLVMDVAVLKAASAKCSCPAQRSPRRSTRGTHRSARTHLAAH